MRFRSAIRLDCSWFHRPKCITHVKFEIFRLKVEYLEPLLLFRAQKFPSIMLFVSLWPMIIPFHCWLGGLDYLSLRYARFLIFFEIRTFEQHFYPLPMGQQSNCDPF